MPNGINKRVDVKEVFKNIARRLNLEFDAAEQAFLLPLDRGQPREDAIRKFLTDKLPRKYGVGAGLVVSSTGEQSRQCDVVVSTILTRPQFFIQAPRCKYFQSSPSTPSLK
jgi:hypothetical protein